MQLLLFEEHSEVLIIVCIFRLESTHFNQERKLTASYREISITYNSCLQDVFVDRTLGVNGTESLTITNNGQGL